jgi:sulfatase modifying factor 1
VNAVDNPGAKPELLQPSSIVFKKAPRGTGLDNHHNWWAYVPGAIRADPRAPSRVYQRAARYQS